MAAASNFFSIVAGVGAGTGKATSSSIQAITFIYAYTVQDVRYVISLNMIILAYERKVESGDCQALPYNPILLEGEIEYN